MQHNNVATRQMQQWLGVGEGCARLAGFPSVGGKLRVQLPDLLAEVKRIHHALYILAREVARPFPRAMAAARHEGRLSMSLHGTCTHP